MLRRIDRYWRIVGTGLSFTMFGIGGVVLWTLVFPLLDVLNLIFWRRDPRNRIAREIIRLSFRAFIGLMHFLGVLRYEWVGLEKLDRAGLLILANHPSLIDTVFLMAFVKRADCIVKSGLWTNPFTRGAVRSAGYISNANGPDLIEDCIRSLRRGNNLIIFPEGTRTEPDGVLRMKRGAANVAIRGARTVTPVVIRCSPPTLAKGDKWWRVPLSRVQFRLEVGEDIAVESFIHRGAESGGAASSNVLAARHLNDYLQIYFTEEKQHHA